MCGIYGIKEGEINKEVYLANKKRGGASMVMFDTPNGTFYHFRAPTSGCSLHNLSEAYPSTYDGWGLIGNGVINETFFKSIKDEGNNNDLYYILKNIVNHGFKWLEQVEGCFALCVFDPEGNIYLVRNTFPLYYNKNEFSSTPIKNGELLKDCDVLDWNKTIIAMNLNLKESPYLL